MTDRCEVVTISTANGPVEINKSDFDPTKHRLYVPSTVEKNNIQKREKDKK